MRRLASFYNMNTREAVALISAALPVRPGRVWADFGAGDGTFTRALIELLGAESRVYAVDRDADALASMDHWPNAERARVIPVVADLAQSIELPELDGALFANTLHFIRDHATVLARLVKLVKPGGRVVLIEYDRRAASQWVPYPISSSQLPSLAAAAGLAPPVITSTRRSNYGGELYVAACDVLPERSD